MNVRSGVVAFLFIVAVAVTPATASAAGWTDPVLITEINQQPTANGYGGEVMVTTAAVTGNTSGCSASTGFYSVPNDDRQRRIVSMLLAAQAAGRQVRIYFVGSQASHCHVWGHALMDGVIVIS